MNRFTIVTCLGFCALMSFAASPANAILIATDDFESYSAGSDLNGSNGGIGWTGSWNAAAGHVTVQPQTIADPNGLVGSGSQSVQMQPTSNLGDIGSFISRSFAPQTGDVYMSVLVNAVNGVDNADFYNFMVSNGATGNSNNALGVGIRNNANNPLFARVGSSGAGQTVNSATNATDNTEFLVVAKFSKDGSANYNRTDLYINPTSFVEPGVADATATSGVTGINTLSLFNIRNFNPESGDTVLFDSLQFGTTFADVVSDFPNPNSFTTLSANADAYVQNGGDVNTNFGADAQLRVKANNNDNDFSRKTYLQFDVSGIGTAETANLQLTIPNPVPALGSNNNDLTYTFNVFGLNDGVTAEDWDESLLTWNNAPGNDITSRNLLNSDATLLGTFTVTGRGAPGEVIDFTSFELIDFLNMDTDGLATLILTRATVQTSDTVVHVFSSKEGGFSPLLVVGETIPEPATALLGLLGLAGLARRRRAA